MPANVGQDDSDNSTLAPDEAFSALGNTTRIEILQTLGEADGPLSFSELRNRVGVRDSGQFNYHLSKLEGHFLRKRDEGYEVRQPGRRVIEAVLSGAVTDASVIELADVDVPCFRCGAPTKISFREEWVSAYCTECDGVYGDTSHGEDSAGPSRKVLDGAEEYGLLGGLSFPSAGIHNRTPTEVFEAAYTWSRLEVLAEACGICPRCAAPIDESISVCEDHDTSEGLCDQCESWYELLREWSCENCNQSSRGPLQMKCWADTEVLAFLTTHGENPFRGLPGDVDSEYNWKLISKEPFKAECTIEIDDDVLKVTFDESLSIVEVETTEETEFS